MTTQVHETPHRLVRCRPTRRDRFLALMEQIVPWERMQRALQPLYPTEGPSLLAQEPLQRMLRMYFVQQWYRLNDETVHDALIDMRPLRRFVGIDLKKDHVPAPATMREFKRLLEAGRLSTVLVVEIRARLAREGLQMRQGCFVDAAIMPIPNTEDLVQAVRESKMSGEFARQPAKAEHESAALRSDQAPAGSGVAP